VQPNERAKRAVVINKQALVPRSKPRAKQAKQQASSRNEPDDLVFIGTLSLSLTHTHTHTLSLSLSLSLTHTHTHSLALKFLWISSFHLGKYSLNERRSKVATYLKRRLLRSLHREVNYNYYLYNFVFFFHFNLSII
jgi:hypothetical protein